MSRWGPWVLSGDVLVYRPQKGEMDPCYEFDISGVRTDDDVANWVRQVEPKRWSSPSVVQNLFAALETVKQANQTKPRWTPDNWDIDAPYPMRWSSYERQLSQLWSAFLASAEPSDERVFQCFLEQHPALLPDPFLAFGGGHNGLHLGGVITQGELPGFRAKHPDFIMLAHDSATVHAVLIEIEAPAKPWCNADGSTSAKLTRALDQIREWKAWFAEPSHQLLFRELYRLDRSVMYCRTLAPKYVLIYGRRSEARRIEAFAKRRPTLTQSDELLMSYDRLRPSRHLDATTLRLDRSGPDTQIRCINIPPTFALNTHTAEDFARVVGREDAIEASSSISEERKRSLIERLPLADNYVRRMVAE